MVESEHDRRFRRRSSEIVFLGAPTTSFIHKDRKLTSLQHQKLSQIERRVRLGSLGSSFDSEAESVTHFSENRIFNSATLDQTITNIISSLPSSKGSFSISSEHELVLMAESLEAESSSSSPTETWYFEFPQDLCGRLIGRKGNNINYIKYLSGADVYVTKAWSHVTLRTIKVSGTVDQISSAVQLIENRFPGLHLRRISNVRVLPVVAADTSSIKISQVQLPFLLPVEVIVPSVLDAGHFYIHLHSTATQSVVNGLQMDLASCYESKGQGKHLPSLPYPPSIGTYCAARVEKGWFRTQLVDVSEDGTTATVVCVDYGIYYKVPLTSLKQLRSDFFKVPFQAIECHLANVVPLTSELTYSTAATCLFETFTQGKVVEAILRAYRNGIPCLDLRTTDEAGQIISINQMMVESELTRWSNALTDV